MRQFSSIWWFISLNSAGSWAEWKFWDDLSLISGTLIQTIRWCLSFFPHSLLIHKVLDLTGLLCVTSFFALKLIFFISQQLGFKRECSKRINPDMQALFKAAWITLTTLLWPKQVILDSQSGFIFFYYWNISALQCCFSFCCTREWIAYKYTQIPSLLNLLPTSPIPWIYKAIFTLFLKIYDK